MCKPMDVSMRKYLIWISALLLSTILSVQAQTATDNGVHRFFVFDSVGCARYQFTVEAKQIQLSGICMLKDSTIETRGTIFNEFGIKALDLIYDKREGKTTLLNLVDFLDKWYIRAEIKSDMNYLFHADCSKILPNEDNRTIEHSTDNGIVLKNRKYGLTYTFCPLKEEQQDEQVNETTE